MKNRTITIQFLGKPRKLRVLFSQYGNGAKAVILNDTNGEQFCVLSVNMPDASDLLPPDVFYAKGWSENEPVVEELKRLGFLAPAADVAPARSGYVEAQAFRWVDDPAAASAARVAAVRNDFNEADCGGAFDGNTVTSDADPCL